MSFPWRWSCGGKEKPLFSEFPNSWNNIPTFLRSTALSLEVAGRDSNHFRDSLLFLGAFLSFIDSAPPFCPTELAHQAKLKLQHFLGIGWTFFVYQLDSGDNSYRVRRKTLSLGCRHWGRLGRRWLQSRLSRICPMASTHSLTSSVCTHFVLSGMGMVGQSHRGGKG